MQPPSGGCVLKQNQIRVDLDGRTAATFGWLCVETSLLRNIRCSIRQPPSGGCVLKLMHSALQSFVIRQPPSGGCVLKQFY